MNLTFNPQPFGKLASLFISSMAFSWLLGIAAEETKHKPFISTRSEPYGADELGSLRR